jgi:putative two-component system response regulator
MAGKRVLVIEDNAMNMELALALLEEAGCSAAQATSAEAGIEIAKARPPQLILMDVSLPGMDGLTAMKVLKQEATTKDIPVVVMTAHAMQGDEAKAVQAGCDGYLTKPFHTHEFLQIVTRFIGAQDAETRPNGAENAGHRSQESAGQDASKFILIVDDEEANRDLLEALLESLGHHAESIHNGAASLNRLREENFQRLPDLVLLDVMMPGVNGFEVARAIRQEPATADLPIVMVTALSSKEDRLRAVEAGANDFIAKPIDKTELRVRITSLLRMKEAQDAIKRHRAALEETVKQRTCALRQALAEVTVAREEADQAHLDTIYRLAVASEYKDKDTATHIQRVGNYCGLLGRHLGLLDDEVEILVKASPMHDVGKLGIPDAILLKPGKLDSEEWAIMKEHTTIGARILHGSSSRLLRAGEIIALSHHEKWDGSGYPNGWAGTAIPLWGRICAIADVFDALTHERPYKKAFTNEEACEIMRNERGRQFDPTLLDLFLRLGDEILAIQSEES